MICPVLPSDPFFLSTARKASEKAKTEAATLHGHVQTALKAGETLNDALFVSAMRHYTEFGRALSTEDAGGNKRTILLPLSSAAPGTRIMLVSIGFEALSGNEHGLVEF